MEDMYNYGESYQRTNTAYVLVTTELVLSKTQQTIFTSSTIASTPEDRRGSTFSSRSSQLPVRAATGLSVQSVSGGPTTRQPIASSSILTPPRRVVVILPQTTTSSHRLLTINIANGISDLQPGLDWKRDKSKPHVTMRKNTSRGEFLIGNFESKEGVPAIPIDPKVFQAEETLKVEWVDIEFKDEIVSREFEKLCNSCRNPESTTSL
ncbi:hypothetical protein L207DRAFT_300368 [Hyaloscypha variabilis F]|uniref:Uncharacterized protein n=1 Tax=Hyaloscypha variabilis (strain UAMH 11265 / GT02V1 / F) TaxID=1149755 RepID=A0A2J6RYI7_HYAVF|nr:hypothetical protein L207DRAFT_300368 [Hyaloscypha variabilis F]